MPPRAKKKKVGGITAFHAAAFAAAAPANAAAAPADGAAAPPEPYFGANGVATTRANSLPSLPGFDTFRGANSATVPPLPSTAPADAAAAPAALPRGSSGPSGLSGPSGSVFSFFNSMTNITTPSIRRTTDITATTPSIPENELLTPSSITTEGEEYGGGGEAIDLREEDDEICLPTISTVWECAYINYTVVNGKDGWECQWCGLRFKPRHATRALRHVLKLKGGDIAICKSGIGVSYRDRYQALYDRQTGKCDSKRKADERISDSVTEQQEAAVKSLLETRKQPWVSGFVRKSPPPHSLSSSNVASASGGAARSSSSTSLQGQRSAKTMFQSDIRKSNDATVEMAIADFFHCENIPDAVVESPRFKRLISVCRLLGDNFVPPNAIKLVVRYCWNPRGRLRTQSTLT